MLVRAIKSFLHPGTVQPVVAGEMFDLPEVTVRPWIDDGRAEELHVAGGELLAVDAVPTRRKRETAVRVS